MTKQVDSKTRIKPTKKEREMSVLFGVVEQYLRTGKPVGSQLLQEMGFPELSSATIRNYFTTLESEGYLLQQHTSGGREPMPKAFRLYAHASLDQATGSVKGVKTDDSSIESKEVVRFLHESADKVSLNLNAAVFLTLPRFDRDGLLEIKYVPLDRKQILAVYVTTFGTVHTEIVPVSRKVRPEEVRNLESFSRACLVRAQGGEREQLETMSFAEREFARALHQEVMARFLVAYSSVSEEDLYRTGFSRLLSCTDGKQTQALSSGFALFENRPVLRGMCRDALRSNSVRFWIGDDLDPFVKDEAECALITAPYRVGSKSVGAIGVIGPMRMFYRELFEYLLNETDRVSKVLTKSLCTFQIGYKEPETGSSKELMRIER